MLTEELVGISTYVDGGISMNIFGYVSKSRQQRNPRDTTGYGFNPIIC